MPISFNKTLLIAILLFLAVLASGFFLWKSQKLVVVTDKEEYIDGAALRLKVRSLFFNKETCFSSCYPYFLEKKEEDWRGYKYKSCPFPDRIGKCLSPGEMRAFATSLPDVVPGIYRISVPVCQDCSFGQEFRETSKFYSNNFEIR